MFQNIYKAIACTFQIYYVPLQRKKIIECTVNLLKLYSDSFQDNWRRKALTDYTSGKSLTYGDFAKEIATVHFLFQNIGIKPGDKIGLAGNNSIKWIVIYFATISYGATIVPLNNSHETKSAIDIIRHSDASILFVDDNFYHDIDFNKITSVRLIISLDSGRVITHHSNTEAIQSIIDNIETEFNEIHPSGFAPADIHYPNIPGDSIASIDYTAGTTGNPKGAMITYDNLGGNVAFGLKARIHCPGSNCLAYMPLSYAFNTTFDLLLPLAVGSHITLYNKPLDIPTLAKVIHDVKPYTILFIPKIFEKLVYYILNPLISNDSFKRMMRSMPLHRYAERRLRNRLNNAFGGNLHEAVIGGSSIDPKIDEMLHRIGFHFSIGYGMTECAPFVSYSQWKNYKINSCGQVLKGIMQVKVTDNTPAGMPGEICVKGMNLMKGYYKNPEATARAIDKSGWFHTGDIGTVDNDGTIYIKGRQATIIEGIDGLPIYPERIEQRLSNMPYIDDCLIVKRGDSLTALIYPDNKSIEKNGISPKTIPSLMRQNIAELNLFLPVHERINDVEIMDKDFVKTRKYSIVRHLYK